MHIRVLPEIQAGQIKTEAVDGAAQIPEAPPGKRRRTIFDKRLVNDIEIRQEIRPRGIG